MAGILSGDVVWADLDPERGHEQAGARPVLVVSGETFNRHSGTVIVMALTSQPRKAGFPLSLELRTIDLAVEGLNDLLAG